MTKFHSKLHTFIEFPSGWHCAICGIHIAESHHENMRDCENIPLSAYQFAKRKKQMMKENLDASATDMDNFAKDLGI